MRPRRLIASLIVSLILGAGPTVLVAVACTTRTRPIESPRSMDERVKAETAPLIPPEWMVRRFPQERGSIAIDVREHRGTGVLVQRIRTAETMMNMTPGFFDHELYIRRAGWPWFAFGCTATMDSGNVEIVHGAIPVPKLLPQVPTPQSPGSQFLLPFGPLWRGFALDTLCYAAAALMTVTVAGLVRRRVRRARGQCTHCGYDRRGLADGQTPCPECGTVPVGGR